MDPVPLHSHLYKKVAINMLQEGTASVFTAEVSGIMSVWIILFFVIIFPFHQRLYLPLILWRAWSNVVVARQPQAKPSCCWAPEYDRAVAVKQLTIIWSWAPDTTNLHQWYKSSLCQQRKIFWYDSWCQVTVERAYCDVFGRMPSLLGNQVRHTCCCWATES
jgi:hypothetical protein